MASNSFQQAKSIFEMVNNVHSEVRGVTVKGKYSVYEMLGKLTCSTMN